MISPSNIEEKLYLLQESLLTAGEVKELEEYLACHPEAQELKALYDPNLKLPCDLYAGEGGFPCKDSLRRSVASTMPLEQQYSNPAAGQKKVGEYWRFRLPLGKSYAAAACAIILLVTGIFLIINFDGTGSSSGIHVAMRQDGTAFTLRGLEDMPDTLCMQQAGRTEKGIAIASSVSPSGEKYRSRRVASGNMRTCDTELICVAKRDSEHTHKSVIHSACPDITEGQQDARPSLVAEVPGAQTLDAGTSEPVVVMCDDLIVYADVPEDTEEEPWMEQTKAQERRPAVEKSRMQDYECSGLLCWIGFTPLIEEKLERGQKQLAALEEGWNAYWSERVAMFSRRRS